MIWIVLTVVFYLTSGLFFMGFFFLIDKEFCSNPETWNKLYTFIWIFLWPIVCVIFIILISCSEIREWLHG